MARHSPRSTPSNLSPRRERVEREGVMAPPSPDLESPDVNEGWERDPQDDNNHANSHAALRKRCCGVDARFICGRVVQRAPVLPLDVS